MHQRAAKIGLRVRPLGSPGNLQARRLVWLAVLLVAASLAEGSLAGVASRGGASPGREQVFRVGRLAPTRGG